MTDVDHEYVALLHALKRECDHEVASALVGRRPSRQLLKALEAVVAHRAVKSMLEELHP